jgi:hypothetical protein
LRRSEGPSGPSGSSESSTLCSLLASFFSSPVVLFWFELSWFRFQHHATGQRLYHCLFCSVAMPASAFLSWQVLCTEARGPQGRLEDRSSISKGVEALSSVIHDINCVFSYLLENPRFCDLRAVEMVSAVGRVGEYDRKY